MKKITTILAILTMFLVANVYSQDKKSSLILSIHSEKQKYSNDAVMIILEIVVENTSKDSVNLLKIFEKSQIIINGQNYPLYLAWRASPKALLSPGAKFPYWLNLKNYPPFQESGKFLVKWQYKEVESNSIVIEVSK